MRFGFVARLNPQSQVQKTSVKDGDANRASNEGLHLTSSEAKIKLRRHSGHSVSLCTSMPIYLMFLWVLPSVEFCFTLKTCLKGAPFYNASAWRKCGARSGFALPISAKPVSG